MSVELISDRLSATPLTKKLLSILSTYVKDAEKTKTEPRTPREGLDILVEYKIVDGGKNILYVFCDGKNGVLFKTPIYDLSFMYRVLSGNEEFSFEHLNEYNAFKLIVGSKGKYSIETFHKSEKNIFSIIEKNFLQETMVMSYPEFFDFNQGVLQVYFNLNRRLNKLCVKNKYDTHSDLLYNVVFKNDEFAGYGNLAPLYVMGRIIKKKDEPTFFTFCISAKKVRPEFSDLTLGAIICN